MIYSSSKKGLTLIEVMVSTSILALLAAIIFANLNQGRVKAAEVKALQESKSIQTALEFYRLDNNKYPDGGTSITSNLSDAIGESLIPEYINYIPEIENNMNSTCSDFEFQYKSIDGVAQDDSFYYRCGRPGTEPDDMVIFYLINRGVGDLYTDSLWLRQKSGLGAFRPATWYSYNGSCVLGIAMRESEASVRGVQCVSTK